MASNPGIAEISIEGNACRLYGSLIRMSQEGLVVNLEHTAMSRVPVPSGSPASVTIVTGSALFTASGRVVSQLFDQMELAFLTSLKRVQRRSDKRVPVDVAVMYRAERADGRTSPWQPCLSYDVSAGGICLKLDERIDDTQRIELCFALPSQEAEGPIRASGRIAHQRLRADGCIAAGVAFTAISSRDKMRMVRFVD